jgi:hypothetical protein
MFVNVIAAPALPATCAYKLKIVPIPKQIPPTVPHPISYRFVLTNEK